MSGMHIVFNKSRHILHPLGNFEDNYIQSIAKIPASSITICTDSHLHRLYTYDLRRAHVDKLHNEQQGYVRDDLAVASVELRDEGDGDAVCADVCVDPSGYRVYALMLSREGKGAWVKVFTHMNRKLTATGLRYTVPADFTPLTLVFRNDLKETIPSASLYNHIGVPVPYQQLCYGAGIEFFKGSLYVLTRRKVECHVVNTAYYDLILEPQEPVATGTDGTTEEDSEATDNRASVRLYERRVAEYGFSLLTRINTSFGVCEGNYYLSRPATTEDRSEDAVFHGLTNIDGQLVSQIRYDHTLIPVQTDRWHLKEAKTSMPDEWYNPMLTSIPVRGVTPMLYGTPPDDLTPYTTSALLPRIAKVVERIKSIDMNTLTIPTLFTQMRGQTVLVTLNPPDATMLAEPLTASNNILPYTIIYNRFPYGISMAYSLSADNAERKLYGVYGNQVWVFDMMNYDIMVRYPNDEGGYTFFTGDIIDMGDITLLNRNELQCFFRNNSNVDMQDVHLIIDLTEGDDPRWKEVFLSFSQGTVGYKDLALGTVIAGGSKEFWIEIHPQDIKEWEMGTSHRLPLKVTYINTDDNDP